MIRANPQIRTTAVGYVRRSTDRQEQSIGDQKKTIEAYASQNRLKLLEFYVDDAISGTSTIKRKAFLKMISDAESKTCKFSNIIVYDIKRFGRIDNDEAGFYRHKLKISGVSIFYATENFNGDYTDDLLRPVKQWQTRQESKDLSKVTIRGLLSKVQGGSWMGGVPPYGYDLRYENSEGKFLFILRYLPDRTKLVIDEKGKITRTLQKDETIQVSKKDRAKLIPGEKQKVQIIKEIFDSYVTLGKGFKSIAHNLNKRNIPTARGPHWASIYSGKWNGSAVRYIIDNPLYSGDMVWNRRTDGKFHKISNGIAVDRIDIHGHRLVPNDKTDWIIVRDAHEPLIPGRIFEAAKQRRLNKAESILQRGHGKRWDGKRCRFILSGIIKCAKCNSRYQGYTGLKTKSKSDSTRTKKYYYACGGYISRGRAVCRQNLIPQINLEKIVIENILQYYSKYLQKDGRDILAQAIRKQTDSEDTDFKLARIKAGTELERIDGIINNLLDNLTAQNRDLVDKRLNQLKNQRTQLESRLEELQRLESSQDEIQNIISDSMRFISSLEYILKNGQPEEKLTLIRQCVERIIVDKENNVVKINIYIIPANNLRDTEEICRKLVD